MKGFAKLKKKIKAFLRKLSPSYHLVQQNQEKLNQIERSINELKNIQKSMFWLLEPKGCTIEKSQKNFWSQYPKAEGELKIIQQCNLLLLKQLKTICDEHDLHFWLHGGTLIGAERHEGPIPWDDDVDVGMMRDDLEKLIEITAPNEQFKVYQYYHDDHTFSRAYQFKSCNQTIPCFIDIFVFDKCSVRRHQDKLDFLNRYRSQRREMVTEFLSLPEPLVTEDVGYVRFGPFSDLSKAKADEILERHSEILGDLRKGNSIYYSLENYPFTYPVMEDHEVFPTRKIKFGEDFYEAPKDSKLYLVGYGDIWQIPNDIGVPAHLYWYLPHIEKMKEYIESQQGENA